ncbi:MAG: UPF0104 family protein, partial [Comamonas sp.]|nr:UPF0104 family protein [Comamonas sp.]
MSHYKPFIIALWVLALLIAGMTLARLPLSAIHDSIAALSATQWTGWITINALIVAVLTRRWQILSSLLG